MKQSSLSKHKIVNDPIYGFINIPSGIIHDLIEHPYFQRLRRIRQLGMTNYVYPAANHTRFQHALGAMHLMDTAIDVLISKGHTITPQEAEAAKIAILLHDIGHGPFSHALENTLIEGLNHEVLSAMIMDQLNQVFEGKIETAIAIFKNRYPKCFLHQLVSSQLDMDRLDYLNRDSFFTGVNEGVIGSDRIIKMLNVVNDELVVEAKGIYSIEKYLIARRLMYWQVYLHKTVLAAETLLINILRRAREVALQGTSLFATPALHYFLYHTPGGKEKNQKEILAHFLQLDDSDITVSVKAWTTHSDRILSDLCNRLIHRRLYKIVLQHQPFPSDYIEDLKQKAKQHFRLSDDEMPYYVFSGSISNHAYSPQYEKIEILYNNGTLCDVAEASDMLNLQVLSKVVEKHFICYPKELA